MNTNLAYALPEQQPRRHATPTEQRRHIEIVASREQRHARPRLAYSLVIVLGLFAVLAIQLLLSIALADGAYQISALQAEQKELSRSQQSVAEELHVLGSPQNLAAQAESLGMVSNVSAAYLSLADGTVLGVPQAAASGAGSVVGADGALLIANSLLGSVAGSAPGSAAQDAATTGSSAVSGAPDQVPSAGSVASTSTGIPGPSTR